MRKLSLILVISIFSKLSLSVPPDQFEQYMNQEAGLKLHKSLEITQSLLKQLKGNKQLMIETLTLLYPSKENQQFIKQLQQNSKINFDFKTDINDHKLIIKDKKHSVSITPISLTSSTFYLNQKKFDLSSSDNLSQILSNIKNITTVNDVFSYFNLLETIQEGLLSSAHAEIIDTVLTTNPLLIPIIVATNILYGATQDLACNKVKQFNSRLIDLNSICERELQVNEKGYIIHESQSETLKQVQDIEKIIFPLHSPTRLFNPFSKGGANKCQLPEHEIPKNKIYVIAKDAFNNLISKLSLQQQDDVKKQIKQCDFNTKELNQLCYNYKSFEKCYFDLRSRIKVDQSSKTNNKQINEKIPPKGNYLLHKAIID